MKTKEWRALIKQLRREFPVDSPVEVRRCSCNNYSGITRFNGKKYYIRINSNQQNRDLIDTLIHEWSHVLTIESAYHHDLHWRMVYYGLKNNFLRKR